jgi:zinc protease
MMMRFAAVLAAGVALALPARAAVEITEVTSPGGITAWLVEEHQIPFVALELYFTGGASMDAPGKRGAVNLMTGLIEEGAGDMSAQDFAAAQEALATSISFDVFNDGLTVSMRFLTENRDASLELLRLALTEPQFEQAAIDRVRGQILSDLRFKATQPDEIASAAYAAQVYGDHPYGSELEGTPDTVSALTRDDILAAHQAVITRDKLHVAAVGDITAEDLGALLDEILGGLPATGPEMPGDASPVFDGEVTVVPFATPQSVAVFGHTGIPWEDDDFFPAFILNTILGAGGFESRLMTEVREKRGLTYGIGTGLATRAHADVLQGSFSSSNERIAEAIEVIRQQWQQIAAEGVTQEELDLAKQYMTGSYPLRFDGNGRIAGILASMFADDFPIDYALTRNDRVNAVTLEDIKRVAARLMDPEALTFVVVGQPEGIEATN